MTSDNTASNIPPDHGDNTAEESGIDPTTTNRATPDPPASNTVFGVAGRLLDAATRDATLRALPGVTRTAATALWRTNQWALRTTLHVSTVVVRGALSGQPTESVIAELSDEARQSLRRAAGVDDEPAPLPRSLRVRIDPSDLGSPCVVTLPQRMDALLDASADLTYPHSQEHPAYVRMLSELAPDEARILRLFAQSGAQPAVDVRTRKPFGIGSSLVAPGLTMIGRYAGCRDTGRVPSYLDNLFRLGLIWFSREPLPEHNAYDVLEAQDDVAQALVEAGRGTTVRRRIELTAFGQNLCAVSGLLPGRGTASGQADNAPQDAEHEKPFPAE